ncbi:MAG TPA: glycine dehydrogenase (aminomethyl-transferring) [Cryomorphaceae bacterium]|nr:glycine dehydrogenase (aminomethyl-transferring) [Owenweeksia sp.]HBF18572.1 glycine dehydrogenase (aminomethyl-transferring) [Cryomorphaceae bacterium]|tara:strand:+ start:1833 stop:4703 length:2871 start_codon:yes stop_codon:yes gene_type:complete
MTTDSFAYRHIGPRPHEVKEMLDTIGVSSLDELIDQTIPKGIRLKKPLQLSDPMGENEFINRIRDLGRKNKVFKTYIGLGYHPTIMPGVIQRNILENPGWYTAYTPYQAEIAQGRLEALLNFQTMISDLTGLPIANASLLDESTAAAEAMSMFYASRSREKQKAGANKFFVSIHCLHQNIDLLKTRSEPLGIELVIGDHREFQLSDDYFGALLQYPAADGEIFDYRDWVEGARQNGVQTVVAADIMSLVLLTPPGEWGVDAVVGTTQRFGIPLGFGGPHAAYFATTEDYKRHIPGRIIGRTIDKDGNSALRMALQTREQHIKRERATSNICTAQVLLAVMAGMYGVYHGPEGLKNIAQRIHRSAVTVAEGLRKLGYEQRNESFFDTLRIETGEIGSVTIRSLAEKREVNFRYINNHEVGISLSEVTNLEAIREILSVFAEAKKEEAPEVEALLQIDIIPGSVKRQSSFLQNEIFRRYHSETEMMRYLKKLERKDLSLNHSMIPLGSCTMKLNAATEMLPLSWPLFANIHPFAPEDQTLGYREMISELERDLAEITGFHAMSMQPNSGAQGEYAGLMVIRAYHHSRGEGHRNVTLIPSSAHGTNPASAIMAGMKVVVVKCDDNGNIDVEDLKAKAEKYKDDLSSLMITYPSTHGVFEESVREITSIIHQYGGQVYMDGANMNAQVGLTSPGNIGADVCHLNLHKTFAIPHGGGGPGMGPIGVAEHLASFLPSHRLVKTGGKNGISAVSAAPFGSGLILIISYGYIKMLGAPGLQKATEFAILNANYLKAKLEDKFQVLYTNEKGRVAHEMILDCRPFKKNSGVEVVDIAKRLMDYGYHAPTVSFPVAGTVMIEPTESESKDELDRFSRAMLAIHKEIEDVASGQSDITNNVLKNAPHTLELLTSEEWKMPYSRQDAAFPLPYIMENKFWPSVRRVDDAYGDRNLICTCEPMESYAEA